MEMAMASGDETSRFSILIFWHISLSFRASLHILPSASFSRYSPDAFYVASSRHAASHHRCASPMNIHLFRRYIARRRFICTFAAITGMPMPMLRAAGFSYDIYRGTAVTGFSALPHLRTPRPRPSISLYFLSLTYSRGYFLSLTGRVSRAFWLRIYAIRGYYWYAHASLASRRYGHQCDYWFIFIEALNSDISSLASRCLASRSRSPAATPVNFCRHEFCIDIAHCFLDYFLFSEPPQPCASFPPLIASPRAHYFAFYRLPPRRNCREILTMHTMPLSIPLGYKSMRGLLGFSIYLLFRGYEDDDYRLHCLKLLPLAPAFTSRGQDTWGFIRISMPALMQGLYFLAFSAMLTADTHYVAGLHAHAVLLDCSPPFHGFVASACRICRVISQHYDVFCHYLHGPALHAGIIYDFSSDGTRLWWCCVSRWWDCL